MRVLVVLVVLCALGANVARAQPGADQPPPQTGSGDVPPADAPPADVPAAEPPPPSPPPAAAPDARLDAGWQLYHRAFGALLVGDRRRAGELATSLQRDHAGHPAALLSLRSDLGSAPGVTDRPRALVEEPSRAARAELALFQTLHGVVLGVELCVLVECDSGEAFLGLALLGGAAGAGAGLAVKELTSGQRALINNGTFWGAANAGLLLAVVQPDDEKSITLVMMAGQLGGLGLGASLTSLRPTSGQVGLASSGGQWAVALSALSLLAADPDISEEAFAGAVLAAMDAGIVIGARLAMEYPQVSRGQTFVIDAGGIVGAVGGAGLGVLVSGDADTRATPGLAAAGAVVGLGIATYLTRNWGDGDGAAINDTAVHAHLVPAERGRGALAGVSFGW